MSDVFVIGATGPRGIRGNVGATGASGILQTWREISQDYQAQAGDRLIADTGSGSFNVFLPAQPITGDTISIVDGGDFSINSLIVVAQEKPIENINQNLALDVQSVKLELIYNGTSWQITANAGVRET